MTLFKLDRVTARALAYQIGFTAFAAWLIWPVYSDPYLAVVVGAAVALGVVPARLLAARAASWVSTLLYGLFTSVVIGPLLAAPYILTSGANALRNWLDAVTSIVFGWKQLITIDPPISTYHGLMVPTFLVFFVANLLAATITFGSGKRKWAAIFPFMAMVIFAIAFGQQDVPAQTNLFGLVIDVKSAYFSALVLLLGSVKFLTPPAGKRAKFSFANFGSLGSLLRRSAQSGSGIALVIGAILVVVLLVDSSLASSRDVLRSAKPASFTGEELSPLSLYRQSFTDTAKLNQEVLRFDSTNKDLDRIRVAVMPHFDGQVFKVQDELGNPLTFRLLPAELVSGDAKDRVSTNISLAQRNSAWLPLVSNLLKVEFQGDKAQDLGEHFYVNKETTSGALLGDNIPAGSINYLVQSINETPVDPATITATPNNLCQDAASATSVIPPSLCEWLDLQDEDISTANGFSQLVASLRARGYLSHSLDQPTGTNNWMTALPGYAFAPSRAGHSLGRIDQMFKDLIAVQQIHPAGTKNSKLVATAGDDEQFAAAVALLAKAAGYESRVVIGFRTSQTAAKLGVEPCANQTCLGKNLAAWVEISSAGSAWLPLDVTPQFKDPIQSVTVPPGLKQEQSEPGQDDATVLPPAQVEPTNDKVCKENCDPPFDWFGLVFGILGTVLLTALGVTVVVGPFMVIILGKRRRRRTRQNASTLAKRITNAWDEYVDNLIDLGDQGLRRLPANETRPELLLKAAKNNEALVGSQFAKAMVTYTDFAAFAEDEPNKDYEREVWTFVDTEFAKATAGMSRYRKLRVLLSLRSFLYRASESEANTVNVRRVGPDGSTFGAFLVVAKHGTVEGFEWLKPRAKKFIDEKMPFLNKLFAKIAPNVKKLLEKRNGSDRVE